MDKLLDTLFDYQRFEKNSRIDKLMEDTLSRQSQSLSDEEMEFVNAAGETDWLIRRGKKDMG